MTSPKKPTSKLSESLLKYLLAALLVFIPLYPKFPLFFLPRSSVAIRVEDFLFLLTGIVLTIHYLKLKISFWRIPLGFQILVYWLIGGLSVLSAVLITQNISIPVALLHWFRRIQYMMGFFLAYEVVKANARHLRFYLEITVFCAVGVLLYGLAQIYLDAPIVSTMNEEFSKGYTLILQPGVPISSTFAGHYDLAIYLVFILSILAALLTFLISKLHFAALSLLFIGELWLLLQTGLRTAALSAFVSVSLILLLKKRFKLVFLFILVFIVLVANTPRLTGRFDSLFRVIKFKSLVTLEQFAIRPVLALTDLTPTPVVLRPIQQDRSSSIRLDVEWPRALRAFYKNPFLGTGYSSITLATDNDYLRSLGETGLLGFAAFAAILIGILKKISKTPVTLFDLSYFGIFSAMLIVATFIDVFEASKVASLFWIYTGLYFGSQKS